MLYKHIHSDFPAKYFCYALGHWGMQVQHAEEYHILAVSVSMYLVI